MTQTPDGFLVCHNVPIARSGWYKYLGREIGLDSDEPVDVYRAPGEVFSPAALASFAGKPVTNDHPPEGVMPDNANGYVKGSVANIRQGKGDDSDLLLADLIIYDAELIRAIQDGKREVSAGYECDYEPNDDGTYTQTGIVGNHVAVVDQGRAGNRVRIQDRRYTRDDDAEAEEAAKKYGIAVKRDGHRSPPEGYPADREQYADPVNYKYPLTGEHKEVAVEYFNHPSERQKGGYTSEEWAKIGKRIAEKLGDGYAYQDGKIVTPEDRKKKEAKDKMPNGLKLPRRVKTGDKPTSHWLQAIGLKMFAQDAAPEDIQETVDAMLEERKDDDEPEAPKSEDKKTKDDDEDQKAIAALRAEVEDLKKKLEAKKSEDEDPEKSLDAAISELEKGDGGNPDDESKTIEPTEDEVGPVTDPEDRPQSGFKAADSAAAVAFLKKMKPAIAAIKDPAEKKRMADAALEAVKGRPAKPSSTYAKLQKPKRSQDTKSRDMSELGREWMKKSNPHYKDR